MATVTDKSSAQSLASSLIELEAGEMATISLRPQHNLAPGAAVSWGGGGVSWTAKPVSGETMDVAVEYSLFTEGDEDWIAHVSSPFSKPKQENEWARFDRVRFSNNGSSAVYIAIGSSSRMTVETS